MKIYSSYGINEFIICLGYKGALLKKELKKFRKLENWKINFVNTGLKSKTGERIRRIKKFVENDNNFCLSYGDGLCNVNINSLIDFHIKKKKIATLTAVKYKNPKGILMISQNFQINNIKEKPMEYINGGFFVLNSKAIDYIKGDTTVWEQEPLNNLANGGELMSFKHEDFWQPMDTLRDKYYLEELWESNKAPWKLWS